VSNLFGLTWQQKLAIAEDDLRDAHASGDIEGILDAEDRIRELELLLAYESEDKTPQL